MQMPKMLTAERLINEVFGGEKILSLDKLYRMAKNKEIPAMKLQGRWFFPLDEIRDWIKEQSRIDKADALLTKRGAMARIEE